MNNRRSRSYHAAYVDDAIPSDTIRLVEMVLDMVWVRLYCDECSPDRLYEILELGKEVRCPAILLQI